MSEVLLSVLAVLLSVMMTSGEILQYNKLLLAQENLDLKDLGEYRQGAVSYGLVCAPADLRSLPTDGRMPDTDGLDLYQQSGLRLGEGVAVLESSPDSLWYRVRAVDYEGWTKADNIALCTYEEMEDYLSSDFRVTTEMKEVEVDGKSMLLKLGSRIAVEGQFFRVPVINAEGNAAFLKLDLGIDAVDHYLRLTPRNVLRLARRLLGTPYGWGDEGGYNDCSSTIKCIFACFGLVLPRNTSALARMPLYNTEVADGNFDLGDYAPGSILVFPGHVMLYAGRHRGKDYIIHNTLSNYDSLGRRHMVGRTVRVPLDGLYRADGRTMRESITNIISF